MPDQLLKLIIPVALWCPYCGARHVDETHKGEQWDRRAHTTHRCQKCGEDFDVYVSGKPRADDFADTGEIIGMAFAGKGTEDKP